ncbi:oxidoreductase [Streptomyces sp. SID5914]|nr:acyl-CoA dehydrogenase family protein [Streptomyces sp. SID5914]MZG14816.1 oxidoreductase [Streptomyces sp. SID5914]
MTETYATGTGDDLVAVASAMRPALAARAELCERERRLPEETVKELLDSGLFHMRVPRALGGLGCDERTKARVTAETAKACPSTAWVLNILAGTTAAATAGLPEEGVAEIFAGAHPPLVCGVNALGGTATRVPGGYRVDGSWGFASGCLHAGWAVMGVRFTDGAADASTGIVCMPMSELSVNDTWHVAGMRGTGSNTVVAKEVHVPERLAVPVPDGIAPALQRSPLAPAFSALLLGPLLGATESMLETVAAGLDRRRVTYFSYARQSDSHVVLNALGDAAMLIDTAWLHTDRVLADIDAEAATGPMDMHTSARGQADSAHAVRALRRAAALLMGIAGASAYAESNPLQRAWRDLEAGSHHAMLNTPHSLELYGRVLAGAEPNSPLWGPEATLFA